MRYTVPDYYKTFKCIAGDCPATCCAGWQIVIDDAAMKKYMKLAGVKGIKKGVPVMEKKGGTPFGNRLANSIDWENQTFLQYAGRCAFLDERNLCDIYTEAGPDMFCRTCRNYPRHIEEFENEREISLSLSCPVVARMLFDRTEKVQFVSRETDEEEQDEDFDEFLYFILQDCRDVMFDILQDRENSIAFRMAKVLALAHDVQNRIDAREMFDIENVLERYQREGADEALKQKMAYYISKITQKDEAYDSSDAEERGIHKNHGQSGKGRMVLRQKLMNLLSELEVLDPSWTEQVKIYEKTLYGAGENNYQLLVDTWETQMNWKETEAEQLMVYFLFTYFCGAVYDGDAFAKVKMAVVSTLLIQEMELAAMAKWGKFKVKVQKKEWITDTAQMERTTDIIDFELEDRARIAWRFSRELEHSDQNLETMEELMNESKAAEFGTLLRCIFV